MTSSTAFAFTAPNGQPITCLEDWRVHAGPKHERQWKEGRSAMEVAKWWCRPEPRMPDDLRALLDSHSMTRGATLVSGTPELRIAFDDAGGEPRNADLALLADGPDGRVAITVEAKSDESFGELAGDVMADAVDRSTGSRSKGVQRVEQLAAGLLPPRARTGPTTPPLRRIRYQLLTATAGTLAYARDSNAACAVLLVHEFVTDRTSDAAHARNARALDLFVRRLSDGAVDFVRSGELIGPLRVPGRDLFPSPAPLLIGKIISNIRGEHMKKSPEAHASFVDFIESRVLPHREAHPDWTRLDGAQTGGNWEVFGRFERAGARWKVHSDTHFEPLLIAHEAARNGEDPFVEAPTTRGLRLDLREDLSQRVTSGFRHLYIYNDGPSR